MNGSKREAGRELDALVATKVMGWSEIVTAYGGVIAGRPHGTTHSVQVPSFSQRIDYAWRVVERMADKEWRLTLTDKIPMDASWNKASRLAAFRWHAEFRDCAFGRGLPSVEEHATSEAHAICLAALAAIEATNTENARTPDASVPNVTQP